MSQEPLSPIFQLADRFVDEQAALDPILATTNGIGGFDHLLTDLSPEGYEERADHKRRSLAALHDLPVTNDGDRLAKDFIIERFRTLLAEHDAGDWMRSIRAIESPAGGVRSTFDLMPRDGEQAWANITARVQAVPAALIQLRSTYEHGRANGTVAARTRPSPLPNRPPRGPRTAGSTASHARLPPAPT